MDLQSGSKNCSFVDFFERIQHVFFLFGWGGGAEEGDVFPEIRIRIGQANLEEVSRVSMPKSPQHGRVF